MPEAPERAEIEVDFVSCELLLETARACRTLAAAVEKVPARITRTFKSVPASPDDSAAASPASRAEEIVCRELRRIDLLFRLLPCILDPRRIVCLGDRAAENPQWWRANRIHFFCPELSCRQIGELTGLKPNAVRDYIRAAEISADCYENLPEIPEK